MQKEKAGQRGEKTPPMSSHCLLEGQSPYLPTPPPQSSTKNPKERVGGRVPTPPVCQLSLFVEHPTADS